MDRINGAGTIDIGGGRRGFRDENPQAGVDGTDVTALFLNALQEELLAVISSAGLAPNLADWGQLLAALNKLYVNVAGDEMTGALIAPGLFLKNPNNGFLTTDVRFDVDQTTLRFLTRRQGVTPDIGAVLSFGFLDGVYEIVTTALTATENRRGVMELATLAEARAMVDPERGITPAHLRSLRSELRLFDRAVFVTPGGIAWTVPAYVYRIYVTVDGPGGGGGGATSSGGTGGGGGGGGRAEGWIAVSPGQVINGVVGAGGIPGNDGASGANGGDGGTSSFGGLTATGGQGGKTQTGQGGFAGFGSGGQINRAGGSGYNGVYLGGDTAKPIGGNGAPSFRSSIIPAYVDGTGVAGFGVGSGGSGSSFIGTARNGGVGARGEITIEY